MKPEPVDPARGPFLAGPPPPDPVILALVAPVLVPVPDAGDLDPTVQHQLLSPFSCHTRF
jgi:hypothetical protein